MPRKREPSHLALLDGFTAEARAGVPDEWIAEQSGIDVRHVRAWRNYRGLSLEETATARMTQHALQELCPPRPGSQETASEQGWEAPRFVLREPLQYTDFARFCSFLTDDLGASPAVVARGLGVHEGDVCRAVSLWQRHLRRRGKKCIGCNRTTDTRFGPYCCKRCEDAQT